MITYIKIDGFKSFHNFEMEFTPLTVIAGANAAGKSNLFDAFKLLSTVAGTDKIQREFNRQRGELLELFTRYDDQSIAEDMSFIVEMLVDRTVFDAWGAKETLKYTRLRYELKLHRFTNAIGMQDVEVSFEKLETIKHEQDHWLKILPKETADFWRPKVITGRRQTPYIDTSNYNGVQTTVVSQDGSQGKKRLFPLNHASRTVLSSFDSVDFKHILAAKKEMMSWRFLQLNPEDLRTPTSKTRGEDVIDETGKNIAAALYRIKQEDPYHLREISRSLHSFLPSFVKADVVDDIENKQYIVVLQDVDGKEYSSRVLSEGTLRILTLLVLRQDDRHRGLLCFEEPENGIHPFRIKMMATLLKGLTTDFMDIESPLRQIIINTHSSVFVRCIHEALSEDSCTTIGFAQMVHSSLNTPLGKKKLLASKIVCVPKGAGRQGDLFSPQEKMSLQMIQDYLEAKDSESL